MLLGPAVRRTVLPPLLDASERRSFTEQTLPRVGRWSQQLEVVHAIISRIFVDVIYVFGLRKTPTQVLSHQPPRIGHAGFRTVREVNHYLIPL
jgi:hypothetical protein